MAIVAKGEEKRATALEKIIATEARKERGSVLTEITRVRVKLSALPVEAEVYSPDHDAVLETLATTAETRLVARSRRGKRAGLAHHVAMRIRAERLGGALLEKSEENLATVRRYVKEVVNDGKMSSLRAVDRVRVCELATILVFRPTREDLNFAAMHNNHENARALRYVVGMEEWIPIWKRMLGAIGIRDSVPNVALAA